MGDAAMDEDRRLLQDYARERSQDAFASLVRRHVDWVYCCALRRVGDTHLAQDVTQAVFILLEQKATTIGTGVSVTGWLFRAAEFAARDALRAQNRRRLHDGGPWPCRLRDRPGIRRVIGKRFGPCWIRRWRG